MTDRMKRPYPRVELDRDTYLAAEEYAYPDGGQTRPGAAVWPDGRVRRVHAGIPDTYFSIPAHGRAFGRYVAGYLTVESADGSSVDTGQPRWWSFTPLPPYRHVFE